VLYRILIPAPEGKVPMGQPSPHEITELLVAWGGGDESALDRLMPIVYDELRRLAHRYMSNERPGHTLQTTALVNEAYLRLVSWREARWQNRAHFFAVSAQMMRRILVDFARDRKYLKRGGGALQVSLADAASLTEQRASDLVALDEALTALAEVDPRKAQVVEMRFFGGLSVEEVAEVLKVSKETVMRDWRLAKVWLLRELGREAAGDEG
jgi:RNA polymerase sigma factor (TIGR02999 family)